MKKLSVTQVSEMVGKSARHIRNLCKEGKLPCQKMKISTGEKYLVYLDTEEFRELLRSSESTPVIAENTLFGGEVEEVGEGNKGSDSASWPEIISGMTTKIESLAREAGKTELLTSNLMTSEQNVKFYQDEYFKIRHELENTKSELEEVKKQNTSLLDKIQNLEKERENRSKPFWVKLSGK